MKLQSSSEVSPVRAKGKKLAGEEHDSAGTRLISKFIPKEKISFGRGGKTTSTPKVIRSSEEKEAEPTATTVEV